MTDHDVAFRPDYAAPPGDLLTVILEQLGMTQADLAARTGLSSKHVNQVVNGVATLSPETAAQLEYVTGVPAELWAAMDARHQAHVARRRTREKLEGSLDWLDRFDLRELADRGVLPDASRTVETLEALMRYFGIANPEGWDRVWQPSLTSFRRSPAFKPDATATTVWLRAGQRLARGIDTSPFDQKAVIGAIPELRALTKEEPVIALQLLQERMARLGVAVVYVAEFDGCRASGAIWWASPAKAVVLLSNRGKREDRFWFSFFHELGHLVHHAKRDTFIDQNRGQNNDELPPWGEPAPSSGFIDDGTRDSLLEEEADQFASEALIPGHYGPQIGAARSTRDIHELADRIGVSTGIVAGRYQFETGDYKKFNPLRRKVPHKIFTSAI